MADKALGEAESFIKHKTTPQVRTGQSQVRINLLIVTASCGLDTVVHMHCGCGLVAMPFQCNLASCYLIGHYSMM